MVRESLKVQLKINTQIFRNAPLSIPGINPLAQELHDHQQQGPQASPDPATHTRAGLVMAVLDNPDLATQARSPDGINYNCAAIRYPCDPHE